MGSTKQVSESPIGQNSFSACYRDIDARPYCSHQWWYVALFAIHTTGFCWAWDRLVLGWLRHKKQTWLPKLKCASLCISTSHNPQIEWRLIKTIVLHKNIFYSSSYFVRMFASPSLSLSLRLWMRCCIAEYEEFDSIIKICAKATGSFDSDSEIFITWIIHITHTHSSSAYITFWCKLRSRLIYANQNKALTKLNEPKHTHTLIFLSLTYCMKSSS